MSPVMRVLQVSTLVLYFVLLLSHAAISGILVHMIFRHCCAHAEDVEEDDDVAL